MKRFLLVRASVMAAVAAAIALAVAPAPSSAICARLEGEPRFDASDPDLVVFVGTAAEVGMNSQNALFEVDEIWHGAPLPAWQAVFSDAEGGGIWSTQPSFDQRTTYLVVARRHDKVLVSVGCGATQPYTEGARALRPPQVSAPTAAERPGGRWETDLVAGPPWPLFAGGAALTVGAFLTGRSLRRLRPPAIATG